MDTYFVYIDGVVFISALIAAVVLTHKFKKRAAFGVRAVPLFFAAFGATMVVSSMAVGHLFENSYRAGVRMITGSFVFDFHFYSIILMGAMILSFGLYMLRQLQQFTLGDAAAKKRFILAALVLAAITFPVFFFRPIGLLPAIACAISLLGLSFAVKTKKVKVQEMQPA